MIGSKSIRYFCCIIYTWFALYIPVYADYKNIAILVKTFEPIKLF